MQENLTQSLMRGEKIEIVNQRSDALLTTSQTYVNTSRSVKRAMQCRKYKMIAAVICGIIVSSLPCYHLAASIYFTGYYLWIHILKVPLKMTSI